MTTEFPDIIHTECHFFCRIFASGIFSNHHSFYCQEENRRNDAEKWFWGDISEEFLAYIHIYTHAIHIHIYVHILYTYVYKTYVSNINSKIKISIIVVRNDMSLAIGLPGLL